MIMASISDSEMTNLASMWELDHNLDQPMDEVASQLKNMYREKKAVNLFLEMGRLNMDARYNEAL
ncbi:unnamed protein product [Urochloa humidicola]